MDLTPTTCPLTRREHCATCRKRWVGWLDYPDRAENKRKWAEHVRQLQAHHDAAWRAVIDETTLAPKASRSA